MTPLSRGTAVSPEMLIGPGFHKLGYVTTDRDRAVDELRDTYGFAGWSPFDPALKKVTVTDGTAGEARLRCAFSTGRDLVVEVTEPVDGQVDLFGAL